jgi:hypothetical protein
MALQILWSAGRNTVRILRVNMKLSHPKTMPHGNTKQVIVLGSILIDALKDDDDKSQAAQRTSG